VSVEPARANETAEAFVPKAEFTHYERDALVAQVFGDTFEMLSAYELSVQRVACLKGGLYGF